jgi:hypothetical protein
MLHKFLNKSALLSGLVAISLIALPIAEASARPGDRGGKGKARFANQNTKVVVNNNRGSRSMNRGGNRVNRNYNTQSNRNYNTQSNRNYNNRARRAPVNYRNNRRGNRGSGFLPGLVGGAILYSALNNSRRYDNYYNSNVGIRYSSPSYRYNRYNYYSPSVSYYNRPRTEVVYVDRPVAQQVPVYGQPQQQSYVQQQQYAAQNDNCLQSREYTTTIEIGGESVPAYGQACLQPDGSWKFGDPVAVPNF